LIRPNDHCHAYENCAPLGYLAASSGNFWPAFRDNLSVPTSRVVTGGELCLHFVIHFCHILQIYRIKQKIRHIEARVTNIGLFEMIVGVLTTCHTQYT
jgi:hypothetical protein